MFIISAVLVLLASLVADARSASTSVTASPVLTVERAKWLLPVTSFAGARFLGEDRSVTLRRTLVIQIRAFTLELASGIPPSSLRDTFACVDRDS